MFESFENKSQIENLGNQLDKPKFNEAEIKEQCCDVVRDFYNKELDFKYADSGMQGRYEIATDFYDSIKERMGIDAELEFSPMSDGCSGEYNIEDNIISLNSNYLENPGSEDMLNTILHESRHAFQEKAMADPTSVSTDAQTLESWRDNKANYVKPEQDFLSYFFQPLELDADDFANEVMVNSFDSNENLTNFA